MTKPVESQDAQGTRAAVPSGQAELIAQCADVGLANRLRFMANVYFLACEYRYRFSCDWRAAPGCEAAVGDLFELAPLASSLKENRWEPGIRFFDGAWATPNHKSWVAPHSHMDTYLAELTGLVENGYTSALINSPGASDFRLKPEIVTRLVETKRHFYAHLPIHRLIRLEADQVSATWPVVQGDPVVAVHIRTFNTTHDSADALMFDDYSPAEAFRRVLHALPPAVRLAVFSNDPDTVQQVCDWLPQGQAFPARAESFDNSRDTAGGVKTAMADLLLMSRCNAVVGTFYSSFSDEACLFGPLSAKYCPIGDEGLRHAQNGTYHASNFVLDEQAGVVHFCGDEAVLERLRTATL